MHVVNYLRHPDRLFSLLLIGLAALMYWLTGTMEEPVSSPGAISASTFPLLTLLCIVGICGFIIIRPVATDEVKVPSSWQGLFFILLTTVYIALIEPLGFFVVTPLFLIAQPLLENFRRYTMLGISVILITATVYALFVYVLAIPLPAGLLGE